MYRKQQKIKRRSRPAYVGLVFLLICVCAEIAIAHHKVDVIVDGQAIYQVSNSPVLEAEERATLIGIRVQKLISSGRKVEMVTVRHDVDDQWDIVCGDTLLDTVNEHDGVEFKTTPAQLANRWRDALDKALTMSREQRREPISIDGQKLFTIGDSSGAKAFERAAIINERIRSIVEQRLDVKVKAIVFESLHVIQAEDQKLLTITEEDAVHNRSTVDALAAKWAELLQEGIDQAKEQRTGKYLSQVLIKSCLAGILLTAALLCLRWFARVTLRRLELIREQRKSSQIEIGSLALIGLLLRWAVKFIRLLAILATAYYILQLPPYTRRFVGSALLWLDKAIDLVRRALVAELFKLGETSVSMKAIFFVLVFIVMIFLLAGVTRRWLENKLFPQTSMDRGLQHSVATGISYLVIIIGLVIGLQSAGINLSAFAVVAGAVGIGIGFGLQNIANNILSGLIILFERPIQVGDRVEVGAIAGDVVRIHARSTTILTNDNIAVIVPNASFITSTVVNWSHLGDRRVRFHIKVGVAYQSDIKLVKQALLEAAAEHTDILKDPAPSVRFMRFGESSLEFEVRVWTSRLSNRPGQVTSDMNFAIFEKLKKHGIEIPNPQKDVHIRSSVPVELRVENLNELLASEKSPEDEVFKNLK